MGVKFNADEIFQLAERIEQNGEKFYKKAAASNPDGKEILLKLAGMEADHYKTFKALHAEISAEEAEPLVFDPNDETGQYLSAMADGSVFDTSEDPSASLTGQSIIWCSSDSFKASASAFSCRAFSRFSTAWSRCCNSADISAACPSDADASWASKAAMVLFNCSFSLRSFSKAAAVSASAVETVGEDSFL